MREFVGELYKQESRRVFSTLVRLLGDFDRAEEATQEAFAAAVEQWQVYGKPANPRAWLVSTGRLQGDRCHAAAGSFGGNAGSDCAPRR